MTNQFHRNLIDFDNHAVNAAEYATIAARDADTTFNEAVANINKIVKVLDNGSAEVAYFILVSVSPDVWLEITSTLSNSFLELTDTPNSYSVPASAGKVLQVNAAETGVEFSTTLIVEPANDRVKIGDSAAALTDLTLFQDTGTLRGLTFSGDAIVGSGTTDGITLSMGQNSVDDKILLFGQTSDIAVSGESTLAINVGVDLPSIFGINPILTIARNIGIGGPISNVGVGFAPAAMQADVLAKMHIKTGAVGTVGAIIEAESAQTADIFRIIKDGVTDPLMQITKDGDAVFQSDNDFTNAFEVKRADGTLVVAVDTSNRFLNITNTTPLGKLGIRIDQASHAGIFIRGIDAQTGEYLRFTKDDFTTISTIDGNGNVFFRMIANSVTAFELTDVANATVFDIDSTNKRVGIANNAPSFNLDVTGDGRFTTNLTVGADLTVDTDTLFVDASLNRVGINILLPLEALHVFGNARVTGAFIDSSGDPGTSGQVLTSTITGTDWASPIGDVIGPASSTDNAISRFNGVTGKIIQNTSQVTINDDGHIVAQNTVNSTGAFVVLDVAATSVFFINTIANEVTSRDLFVVGDLNVTGAFEDSSSSAGISGQILSSLGTGTDWINNTIGDVVGPASATVNAIARYAAADGKSIKNSTVLVADNGTVTIPPGGNFVVDTDTFIVEGTLDRVSIGAIATPLTDFTIFQRAVDQKGITLSGEPVIGTATNLDGATIFLGHSTAFNRQIFIGETSDLGNSLKNGLSLIVGPDVPSFSGVSMTGVLRNFIVGDLGVKVGVGFIASAAVQADIIGTLHVQTNAVDVALIVEGRNVQTADIFQIIRTGTTPPLMKVTEAGNVEFRNETDSVTGFQILDADGGVPMFNVDTINERIGINNAAPSVTFDVLGDAQINGQTRINNSSPLGATFLTDFTVFQTMGTDKGITLSGNAPTTSSIVEGATLFLGNTAANVQQLFICQKTHLGNAAESALRIITGLPVPNISGINPTATVGKHIDLGTPSLNVGVGHPATAATTQAILDGVKLFIRSGATTNVGLVTQGEASQTADLFQARNSSAVSLVKIEEDGDIIVSAVGSSSGTPRKIQMLNAPTEFNQFLFGGVTGMQSANGHGLDIFAFHTIRIFGDTTAGIPPFEIVSDVGVQIVNTIVSNPAFVIDGAASQTGSLLQLRTNVPVVLSEFDEAGKLVVGGTKLAMVADRSMLDVRGSVAVERLASAGAVSTVDEVIIAVTGAMPAGGVIVTISTADIVLGRIFIIKDESGTATVPNPITVQGQGGETIDTQTSVPITANFGSLRLYSDGTNLFTW